VAGLRSGSESPGCCHRRFRDSHTHANICGRAAVGVLVEAMWSAKTRPRVRLAMPSHWSADAGRSTEIASRLRTFVQAFPTFGQISYEQRFRQYLGSMPSRLPPSLLTVATLVCLAIAPPAASATLVGEWALDEGAGQVVHDRSLSGGRRPPRHR
jgi:hypothetical protein